MKTFYFIAAAFLLFFSACTYEEGPALSLRSKKARAINVWVLSKAFEEGVDKTDNYKTTFVNYKLELNADDNYRITYKLMNAFNYEEKGTWKFSNDKLNIVFTPVNTTQENPFKILKLRNHEAWVSGQFNGKSVELHLED